MGPDDVRWPAVREAARRILRTPRVIIELPEANMHLARDLVMAISDANPARLSLPELRAAGLPAVLDKDGDVPLVTWDPQRGTAAVLFQLIGPLQVSFEEVAAMAHTLLEAGYPGCLGCGGPGLEDPWDEEAWRNRQVTTSFK